MTIESAIESNIFHFNKERTIIDKLLGKDDSERIKQLVSKTDLKREELLELLYLLSGNESKLLNYGEWERYVVLKFFVWIREFVKVCELFYDYYDDLEKNLGAGGISERTKTLANQAKRKLEHNAKFLIDLYLNIGRTSLSLGATGFLEPLKNKFEMEYSGNRLSDVDSKPNRAISAKGARGEK